MDESKNKKDAVEIVKETSLLSTTTDNLVAEIMKENSPDKLKDLTHLFKVHMAKRNILRLIKYYDMMDLVNEQTLLRLEKKPDEITSKDLLAIMTTVMTTIEKTTTTLGTLDDTDSMIIHNQKNEVNINIDTPKLNRDSKEKVVDAIKSLMTLLSEGKSKDIVPEDVIDVEDNDEE